MGDREHAPDTRRRLGAGGRSQGPERRVRDAQGFQDGVTEVVEDFTTPIAATAPRSRRQRLILTTRHPSWQRRSCSRGQKIV